MVIILPLNQMNKNAVAASIVLFIRRCLFRCFSGWLPVNREINKRFTFMANGICEFVPRDQVFSLIVFTCSLLLAVSRYHFHP